MIALSASAGFAALDAGRNARRLRQPGRCEHPDRHPRKGLARKVSRDAPVPRMLHPPILTGTIGAPVRTAIIATES
jgi:hypothetical protein